MKTQQNSTIPPLAAIALSMLLIGCGPPKSPYPSAQVSGNITLDGMPLESGNIMFIPDGTGQSRPTAVDFAGGAYTLKDAPLGKVRVRIVSTKATGKMIPGSGREEPEIIDVVPARYRQGIEIDIAGNNDQLHFELTSD